MIKPDSISLSWLSILSVGGLHNLASKSEDNTRNLASETHTKNSGSHPKYSSPPIPRCIFELRKAAHIVWREIQFARTGQGRKGWDRRVFMDVRLCQYLLQPVVVEIARGLRLSRGRWLRRKNGTGNGTTQSASIPLALAFWAMLVRSSKLSENQGGAQHGCTFYCEVRSLGGSSYVHTGAMPRARDQLGGR